MVTRIGVRLDNFGENKPTLLNHEDFFIGSENFLYQYSKHTSRVSRNRYINFPVVVKAYPDYRSGAGFFQCLLVDHYGMVRYSDFLDFKSFEILRLELVRYRLHPFQKANHLFGFGIFGFCFFPDGIY